MIKAIIFDVGGVCLTPGFGKNVRQKVCKKFHINFEKFEKIFNKYRSKLNKGHITLKDFLTIIKNEFNIKIKYKIFLNYINSLNRANKDILILIKLLKKHYKTVMLNNEIRELNKYRMKKFKLSKYFNYFFSSCEIGLEKPDKNIFLYVLNILKLKPSEVLFIDDNPKNINFANKIGIKSVLHI